MAANPYNFTPTPNDATPPGVDNLSDGELSTSSAPTLIPPSIRPFRLLHLTSSLTPEADESRRVVTAGSEDLEPRHHNNGSSITADPNAPSRSQKHGFLSPRSERELAILRSAAPAPAHKVMKNITILSTETNGVLGAPDPLFGHAVRRAAQDIHTTVYDECGYISKEEIGPDGLYHDPYEDRKRRYIAINGNRVAVAGQIECDPNTGIASLPTVEHFPFYPDSVGVIARVAGVAGLGDLKPGQAVEITGLASRKMEGRGSIRSEFDAVIAVHSQCLAESLVRGETIWFANMDEGLIANLKYMLGEDFVHVVGPLREYMGPATRPVVLSPQAIVRSLLTSNVSRRQHYAAHLRACLEGADGRHIPRSLRRLLASQHVTLRRRSLGRVATDRLREHPLQSAIDVGATLLTAVRAIPAANVPEFQGSQAILWGIDVATLPLYLIGINQMHEGRNPLVRGLGSAAALVGLVAPYAYYYWNKSKDYPWYVNAGIAGFVGVAGLKEALRIRRGIRNTKVLLEDPEQHIAQAAIPALA